MLIMAYSLGHGIFFFTNTHLIVTYSFNACPHSNIVRVIHLAVSEFQPGYRFFFFCCFFFLFVCFFYFFYFFFIFLFFFFFFVFSFFCLFSSSAGLVGFRVNEIQNQTSFHLRQRLKMCGIISDLELRTKRYACGQSQKG